MRKIIFFTLLFPVILFAQKSQTFTYGIKTIENKDSKIDEMISSISPNYKNLATDIRYNLIVKKDSSCFYVDEKTIPDDQGIKMYLALVKSFEKIHQVKDSIYEEINLEFFNKKYVSKDTIQADWQLFNEEKEIMGYKCYKAVCVNTVINDKGTFKNDIIAWYCPELPFQFGPLGYGKLPGLIFELQTKKALFGILKIDLNSGDQICKINPKAEVITQKQLEETLKKLHEERRKIIGSQN